MSDRALITARTVFGWVAAAAVVGAVVALFAGFGGEVFALFLAGALVAAIVRWWFDHSLDVRIAAASFRDPHSHASNRPPT